MKKYSYILGVVSFAVLLAWAFYPTSGVVHPVETALGASADYFLKLDGIDGESTAKGHEKHIEISSWSWGISQTTSSGGGGGGAGKVKINDFTLMKTVDKASPQLFMHSAEGKHIKNAVLTVRKAGDTQDYLTYTFEDVMVSSYQVDGSGGTLPTEQVSLNYQKITIEYKQMSKTGAVLGVFKAAWDFITNTVL